jgi:hypothetical protein
MGRVSAQAALNRQHIVETASRLFRQHGVEGVSIADIMAAAGLTPAVLQALRQQGGAGGRGLRAGLPAGDGGLGPGGAARAAGRRQRPGGAGALLLPAPAAGDQLPAAGAGGRPRGAGPAGRGGGHLPAGCAGAAGALPHAGPERTGPDPGQVCRRPRSICSLPPWWARACWPARWATPAGSATCRPRCWTPAAGRASGPA